MRIFVSHATESPTTYKSRLLLSPQTKIKWGVNIINLEEPCVEVDLLEHAEQVPEPGAEGVESAKDVFLAEAELPDVLPHLAVLHPGVGVFVALKYDTLHFYCSPIDGKANTLIFLLAFELQVLAVALKAASIDMPPTAPPAVRIEPISTTPKASKWSSPMGFVKGGSYVSKT